MPINPGTPSRAPACSRVHLNVHSQCTVWSEAMFSLFVSFENKHTVVKIITYTHKPRHHIRDAVECYENPCKIFFAYLEGKSLKSRGKDGEPVPLLMNGKKARTTLCYTKTYSTPLSLLYSYFCSFSCSVSINQSCTAKYLSNPKLLLDDGYSNCGFVTNNLRENNLICLHLSYTSPMPPVFCRIG